MEKLHINFYEDNMGLDAIAASVAGVKYLLAELETRASSRRAPSSWTAGIVGCAGGV